MVPAVRYKAFATGQAWFCLFLEQLRVQHLINWKHDIQQIVTHDPAERYELWAGMLVSVVKQQAVSVPAVAAVFSDKRVYSFGLLHGQYYRSFDHLLI